MKVRVTNDATEDLRQIKEYVAGRNVTAAEHLMERFRIVIRKLTVLPRLGHAGVVEDTYEINVPRVPFLIVYRIDGAKTGSELVVLRVYHAAQDR